jgi:hypothetical protein
MKKDNVGQVGGWGECGICGGEIPAGFSWGNMK